MTLIMFSLRFGDHALSSQAFRYEQMIERAHDGEDFLTVDVSHWDAGDYQEWAGMDAGHQLGALEGLLHYEEQRPKG